MAAETVTDSNVNPWGLYVRELGFAAAHTGGSIDAAEGLLLYALGEGWIRWLYGRLEFKDSACTPAQLEQVRKTLLKAGLEEEMIKGYLGRELQFFWRPAEHTSIVVGRAKSEATRTGPPWVVGNRTRLELIDGKLTPVEDYWPIFLTAWHQSPSRRSSSGFIMTTSWLRYVGSARPRRNRKKRRQQSSQRTRRS